VQGLVASYQDRTDTDIIEDYTEGSSWLDLVQPQSA